MEDENGHECETNLPHSNNRMLAPAPEEKTSCVEAYRVDNGEDDERDTPAVVVGRPQIVASGIEVRHLYGHLCCC